MQEFPQKRMLTRVVALIGIIVLIIIALEVISSFRFHVTGTNPGTGSVATVSPFFKVSFNKTLSPKNIFISSSYSIAESYKVSGKVLTIQLKSPMTAGYAYYIKIRRIADTKGNTIIDKVFSFTPKSIPWQNLPADQQKALLQTQASHPKSVANINFQGFDALTNIGLTLTQISTLQQEFFEFKSGAGTVSIDQSSVQPAPHDSTSTSTSSSVNFTVAIDGTSYHAAVTYTNLGSDAELLLYDSANNQVFNSNSVNNNED